MRYVKINHFGVSKFIEENDMDSLRYAKASGGEIELDDSGNIRYYTPEEAGKGRNVKTSSVEEIFGIRHKNQVNKYKSSASNKGVSLIE